MINSTRNLYRLNLIMEGVDLVSIFSTRLTGYAYSAEWFNIKAVFVILGIAVLNTRQETVLCLYWNPYTATTPCLYWSCPPGAKNDECLGCWPCVVHWHISKTGKNDNLILEDLSMLIIIKLKLPLISVIGIDYDEIKLYSTTGNG